MAGGGGSATTRSADGGFYAFNVSTANGARGKTGLAVATGGVAEKTCVASTVIASGTSANRCAHTAGASEASETATIDVRVRCSGGCTCFAGAVEASPRADRAAADDSGVVGIPAREA